MHPLKIVLCQMKVGAKKDTNLTRAQEMLQEAASRKASLAILPEMFNCPYEARHFPDYAEPYPGKTTEFLAAMARELNLAIVGGSIPEKDAAGNIYNTSYTFNNKGQLINHYRKIHLFDIDIPGQITFKESDTLSAGNQINVFTLAGVSLATVICYDIRFPELIRLATLKGAQVLIIPASFNLTTGPLHWELLMRCRAVDNQCYIMAASAARNTEASYQAWGHSLVIDPWGRILAEAGESEALIETEIDLGYLEKIRQELPLLKHRRTDLYQISCQEGLK